MRNLSLVILELLEISLGVDKSHYRKLFEDGNSLMRCNSYPPCKEAGLTLGTGPHCDPNSLTILHQDQVGGLEIFANNKWLAIRPRPDAFVVNIGDTFMVRTCCILCKLLTCLVRIFRLYNFDHYLPFHLINNYSVYLFLDCI